MHMQHALKYMYISKDPGGGGGDTQIWFGRGCAAQASKPIPIIRGHFSRKNTNFPKISGALRVTPEQIWKFGKFGKNGPNF